MNNQASIQSGGGQSLAALHALPILDTNFEARFDQIVAFTAAEFDVPIVVISLIDQNQGWFRSHVRSDMVAVARQFSLSAFRTIGTEVVLVPDLRDESCFTNHPMVTADPWLRSYAAAPLLLQSGQMVGTLSVMDLRVRTFDELDCAILLSLRDLVILELETKTRQT